jgi:hypothetical protein
VPAHDWEALGRDDDGNLWIGDIGNNECDRADTALLKVREPDPAAGGRPPCWRPTATASPTRRPAAPAATPRRCSCSTTCPTSSTRPRRPHPHHALHLPVQRPRAPRPALAADLIARPPRWTIPLDRLGATTPVNVEGVAFDYGSHDLTLLAENRDVFLVPAAYLGG